MITLHMGICFADTNLCRIACAEAHLPRPTLDGDGWLCWGEQVNMHGNDADTAHVQWTVGSVAEAVRIAERLIAAEPELFAFAVWPGAYGGQPVRWAMTEAEDWSVVVGPGANTVAIG